MTLDEMARYEERGGMITRTAKLRIDDAGYLGPRQTESRIYPAQALPQPGKPVRLICSDEQAHIQPLEARLQATEQAEKLIYEDIT